MTSLPIIVTVVGAIAYALRGKSFMPEFTGELGRLAFAVGLLAILIRR